MRVPPIRFAHVRRGKAEEPPGIVGVARVDSRTKVLVRRLEPGDIAVIDHPDLDRVSADELIACRVAAVVNASRSVTGRYPNLGPRLLVDAGIPVVDDVGKEVLARIAEGTTLRLDKDTLYNGSDQVIAKGTLLTDAGLTQALVDANASAGAQIDAFAENTLEFLRRERDLLTSGIERPDLATGMRDRHVLVVVRGYRYREDVIIGDMDSVSDEALQAGAELVVHAYPDGRAPGMERLAGLGLDGV